MVKRVMSLIMVLAIILVLPAAAPIKKQVTDSSVKVEAPVADVTDNGLLQQKLLRARFENMLNLNYLYNNDFASHKTIIENSVLALLDKAVDGEIEQGIVLGFIAAMYGLQVDPAACVYEFAPPAKEGNFLILPRGYTEYKHTVRSVAEEVGGFTVVSDVVVMPHDGPEYTTTASTVFVPNEGSGFGYNIISSILA